MIKEHHDELIAMAQRLREIAMHQPNGRRLAMEAIATHIEYGPARAIITDLLPRVTVPLAGKTAQQEHRPHLERVQG